MSIGSGSSSATATPSSPPRSTRCSPPPVSRYARFRRGRRGPNAYAERWVRTVRAECLDWTLIVNAPHPRRVLTAYLEHYNAGRPHRGIDLDVPVGAPAASVTPLPVGPVERVDVLGGLIHEYRRAA